MHRTIHPDGRVSRRTMLRGGAAAAMAGSAMAITGCGDDEPAKAPASVAPPAPSGAGSAPSPTGTRDPTKLSDEEFFKAIPANWDKDWKDEDVKPGGRGVFLTRSLGTQDPFAAGDQTRWQVQGVYSNLIRPSVRQGIKSPQQRELEGDLAVKWETPDLQTITLTVAPNVKFQNVAPVNGRAMTIDDIKYSLTRAMTHSKSTLAKAHNALFQSIEDIGNNQIRIRLSRPEPLADQWLSQQRALAVVPKELGESPELMESKPIGTGAFIQKSLTPNVEIQFERNPDYFRMDSKGRKLPYMDGWRAQVFRDDSTGLNAFIGEQADMTQSSFLGTNPFEAVRDLVRQAPHTHLQLLAPGWGSLAVSGKAEVADSPWRDIRFRRALSMLVPREQLSQQVFKGYGTPSLNFPWAFLSESPPQVKDMGPWYQFNPKEAKALLDASGLANRELDLEYYDGPNITDQMLVFQGEAARIGLKINLAKQADNVTIVTRMTNRSFKDLSQHHHPAPTFIDPVGTMTDYVAGQPLNMRLSQVNDSVMNDLYNKLLTTPLGQERKAIGKQVQDRMLDQVFEIQFLVAFTLGLAHPRFKNWVNTAWAASFNAIGNFDMAWIDPAARLKS